MIQHISNNLSLRHDQMALHIRHTNSLNAASSRAFRIKFFFLSDSIEKCCILLHGNEF